MTPAPLQLGQAPSELALNSAGFTPLAFANALRIGSSNPVYVAGLLRREPRIAPWSIVTTPAPAGIDPYTSGLLPEPATRGSEGSALTGPGAAPARFHRGRGPWPPSGPHPRPARAPSRW